MTTRLRCSSYKARLFSGGIGLVGLFFLIEFTLEYYPTASNQGYIPEQPIPFSHRTHSGDNRIPCLYCHSTAERSPHASVPALSVCMNCHSVVKVGSPHIQKLRAAYAAGKPIEWVRIHELPDHAYFSHKRHVAQGISCETCHGNVKEMVRVEQKKALTMGWCLECHLGKTTPSDLARRIHPEVKDPRGLPVAPIDCNTCHH